jgi:hypothetical protein
MAHKYMKKKLNILSHTGNANQNTEIPSHPVKTVIIKKTINVGKDAGSGGLLVGA